MEDFDKMKDMWLELNERISSLEEANRQLARKVMNDNFKTAQEKLVHKYSLFIIISVVMIFYMLFFVLFNPFVVEKYKLATIIYWSLFFLFEAGMDTYLRYRVKKIDIYNSSVREIAYQASQNWKLHKLAIVIGVPLAIGAVILFGLLLNADRFLIYGMILGGIVGFLIGLRQLRKFYENYRFLQSSE